MRLILLITLAISCSAQPWSGVLSPGRALDYTTRGLPACIPYGTGGAGVLSCAPVSNGAACNGTSNPGRNCVEVIPNPYTPPTRVQAASVTCANNSTDAAAINNALSAAYPGSYVLVGGTCSVTSNINMQNGVTLRGNGGPMNASLNFSGGAGVSYSLAFSRSGALSGSPAGGASQITITGGNDSGAGMPGTVARLSQCNTGYTGWHGCSTVSGSTSDNGGIFLSESSPWVTNPGNDKAGQVQSLFVTSVSGNCTSNCNVTFGSSLSMPNWSSAMDAHLEWGSAPTVGAGLEDFTLTGSGVGVNGYGSWIKGNRFIGVGSLSKVSGLHNLLMSNYFSGQTKTSLNGFDNESVSRTWDTSSALINNIVIGSEGIWGDGWLTSEALLYNYSRYDQVSNFMNKITNNHGPGAESFTYSEGNQIPRFHGDNNHDTNYFDVAFRNHFSGTDGPLYPIHKGPVLVEAFQRFFSFIGNALGDSSPPSNESFSYQGGGCSGSACNIWGFTTWPVNDPLTLASSMRWGNCDTVTGTCRFLASEVPTSAVMPAATYPNAVAWQNPAPANNNLPCSLYFQTSSGACSIKPNGGTGLPFWKVVKTWNTFPTSPATTQTQPYPPIGPDQSGGLYVNGHAYDIPAAVAYKSLPIDIAQQGSFSIAGSSWSATACTGSAAGYTNTIAGPCETLTINVPAGIGNGAYHLVGGFQLSGLNAACLPTSGPSYTGRPDGELLLLGAAGVSSTQVNVVYSLGSGSPDNGSSNQCTGGGSGAFKWPDIRQFDQRVYMADGAPTGTPVVALDSSSHNFGNQTVGVPSAGFVVTLQNAGSDVLAISSITPSGDFSDLSNCPISPSTLGIGSSCTITITFTPTTTGARSGSIQIVDNAADSPQAINLTGSGASGAPSAGSVGSGLSAGRIIIQ